ncbi:MAG: response regulator [Balneolaceae bacterium]|nr:response regulator [Balneolaceae bacterium]
MKNLDIVLIEDDDNDAELAILALKKSIPTVEIIRLRDGEEAIEFFEQNGDIKQKPKLILLDLKMPKIDGLEVLRKIRSNDWVKNLPIVMLTSSREHKDIVESYNLGINSYVVKPVSFKDFADTISSIGRYWLSVNEESTK